MLAGRQAGRATIMGSFRQRQYLKEPEAKESRGCPRAAGSEGKRGAGLGKGQRRERLNRALDSSFLEFLWLLARRYRSLCLFSSDVHVPPLKVRVAVSR